MATARREPITNDERALLLDALDEALLLLDVDGHVCWANASMVALCAHGLSEGDEWRSRIDDSERVAWDEGFARACAGHAASCASVVRRPGGRPLAVEAALRPCWVGDRVRAVAIRLSDPLAQRGNDEMLRWIARVTAPLTGEDFFRSVVRSLAGAFGIRRAFVAECIDKPITRVRTLGYWFDGAPQPDFEFDLAGTPCEVTIRDGQVFCIAEGLAQRYPGARRLGLDGYLGAPIFDAGGEHLIGHVAFETAGPMDRSILGNPLFQIFVSRTAAELRRKRAEDVLRASEEKYRLIVEHQTDVVVRYDAEQRLTFVSPSFCRLFGVEEGTLLGHCFRPGVADEDCDRFEQAWQALRAPPHEAQFEERALGVQGWRWIAWSQKAMLDRNGAIEAVVASGRDITERKRAEEQGRQHLQQLARVGRVSAMGQMASSIAHEINQPLTAVRTYAQACLRLLAGGEDADELVSTLERVAVQAERAGEIVRRLRGFMAREEGGLKAVEPNCLVSEVIDLVRADAGQSGIRLRLRLADALPRLRVDAIQIEQVILNLVRNGIEALQHADATQRWLDVSTRCEDGHVVMSVHDSGPGVAAEMAQHIFEPFYTSKPGGMGIGLSISRSIAQAHGGRLWLDAGTAEGALFHLALPIDVPGEGAA